MIKKRLGSRLTTKTVGITFGIVLMVVATTMLTASALSRLSGLVEAMAGTQMEQLMTSVRLVQQTESLNSLGLMLSTAQSHDQRRAAQVELTDRTSWIHTLMRDLQITGQNPELIQRAEAAEHQLVENMHQLNSLVRKRIDGEARATDVAKIQALSDENRELAGRLSVLMGYFAATMRNRMVSQSDLLVEKIGKYRQHLIMLAIILLVSAILGGIYFERTVVHRILRMQRAVSKPDVSPAELNVGGRDEITQLAATVSSYVVRIKAQETRMQGIHDELTFLAEHDPLTELANRRHFYAAACRLLAQSRHPLCIAIGDIDHFKLINDKYGHAVGDQALIQVARHLKASLRENDIIARFGGEEFAAVLPVRAIEDAERIFEQIRQELATKPLKLESETVTVTLSFGLTLVDDLPIGPDNDAAAEAVLNRALREADLALYEAKNCGRNRVFCSGNKVSSELLM